MLFKVLIFAFIFGYIGYWIGKVSKSFDIVEGSLSDCCSASVFERKEIACLNCGKKCNLK